MNSRNAQKFAFFCFLIFLSVYISAPEILAKRLPVRIYTSADGLGSSFVDDVFRDSRGFIWACTRDGLSRFDGSRFVNYQIGEKNSPPGIENIYETRNGIYFITTTGGTYRFDPNRVSAGDTAVPRLNAERVTGTRGAFIEDGTGNLWLISNKFYRVIEENGKTDFQEVDWGIPPQNSTFVVYAVDKSLDDSIWVYTSWGLVRRLPDTRLVVYTINRSEYGGGGVSTLTADKSGRIWATFYDRVFLLKPEPIESFSSAGKITVKPLKPTSIVEIKPEETVPMPKIGGEIFQFNNSDYISKFTARRIFQSSDGDIWIATVNYLLQIGNGVLRVHSSAEGLPNVMGRMAEDAAGNLWIGGYSGLARLDRNGLITYDQTDGAYSSIFFSITESIDGKLYFGTSNTNITAFDGVKLQSVRPSIPPNATQTWTSRFVLRDSGGDFWVLTTGKLYRFSDVKNFKDLEGKQPSKIYGTEEGLKSDVMFQIYEDSSGDIWVSTRGRSSDLHGLARLKKGEEKFQTFSEAAGFPSKMSPSSFAEDRNGNLWIGFYEGGFGRFDGERFEILSNRQDFPAKGVISDLLLDAKGRLWISSSNTGLYRIDDTSAKNPVYVPLTTENGLSSNNIRTITEDRFGRIYAGTASGVDRISPDTGNIKHYSVTDGLATDFVIDSHLDKNGNVWFATSNGVSRIVPLPDEKTSPPRVFIGGLRIAGEPQAVSKLGVAEIEKGEFSHTQNNLQIDFFGLDLRAGETLRYQYKLEGADTDWSASTEQRMVTFANLSPGTYRFLVRAVNSEGLVSENPAVISFKILPPIYLRWWFIAACVLVLSLIILSVYRYRIAHLQAINAALEETKRTKEERLAELEKVRSRIATDLHDDIGASLTQIAILSEVAQAQSKGNGATDSLTKITNVSNELVGTMSDIVWSINPSKDHLSDLTQRMRRFAADVLSARGIGFHFAVPEQTDEIVVNTNLRREMFLIFKESINNIVKHSGATNAEIEVGLSSAFLTLKISDNGKGFAAEKTFENSLSAIETGGNGILSMQKRAAEMNGEFLISSEVGKGTEIVLKMPLENKHNLAQTTQTGGDTATQKA